MTDIPLPADELAERALLLQLAAGDRAALSELYRAYHRRLARFVGRMTRRTDIVDEVINDCFWIVWQKAGSFRGEARLSTWIMGIAYRCALKALRQHGDWRLELNRLGADSAARYAMGDAGRARWSALVLKSF